MPSSSGGAARSDPRLAARLEQLRRDHGDRVRLAEVAEIVSSLLDSLQGDLSPTDLKVYGELESLARYIVQAKAEIKAIRPEEIPDRDIPQASGELDAIGAHLEQATGTILDCCERIEKVAGEVQGPCGEQLGECVTRIYEACNFQDLTGQRITKIVATLQAIERRIVLLVRAFGDRREPVVSPPEPAEDERTGDERLLNGPQHPASSNSQADIDALLAGFG
jgi:chemotaxis protein CheZ